MCDGLPLCQFCLPRPLLELRLMYATDIYNQTENTKASHHQFKVLSGVRQGGILSPILFNMYVDDLIEALKANGDGCQLSRS